MPAENVVFRFFVETKSFTASSYDLQSEILSYTSADTYSTMQFSFCNSVTDGFSAPISSKKLPRVCFQWE